MAELIGIENLWLLQSWMDTTRSFFMK